MSTEEMKQRDLGWLEGLIDGEGHIGLYKRKHGGYVRGLLNRRGIR